MLHSEVPGLNALTQSPKVPQSPLPRVVTVALGAAAPHSPGESSPSARGQLSTISTTVTMAGPRPLGICRAIFTDMAEEEGEGSGSQHSSDLLYPLLRIETCDCLLRVRAGESLGKEPISTEAEPHHLSLGRCFYEGSQSTACVHMNLHWMRFKVKVSSRL